MTPVGNHQRHCGSCAKHVTDFSWMTDREIQQYLAVATDKLCGRFRADQLDRPIRAYVKPATGWRSLAAAGSRSSAKAARLSAQPGIAIFRATIVDRETANRYPPPLPPGL